MALDKQRILNELGNVVNQLQSADCGCMGNMFYNNNSSNAGQHISGGTTNALLNNSGCRRGCHGHGCGAAYSREPGMNHQCHARCNPPKLYSDTYNYLNTNLMQPVVQEVYDDLRSMTPDNTIMNNPMAKQIGLSNTNSLMPQANFEQGDPITKLNNRDNNSLNTENSPNMGGMGQHIANMMANNKTKNFSTIQEKTNTMPHIHGHIGIPSNHSTTAQDYYTNNFTTDRIYNQPDTQYVSPVNENNIHLPIQQPNSPNIISQLKTNMTGQTSSTPYQKANSQRYNDHGQGMTKFNEMFPGVMQGLGGDLGFDPMAIAIQMNPANQQKTATNIINKLMMNNSSEPRANAPTESKTVPVNENRLNINGGQISPEPLRVQEPIQTKNYPPQVYSALIDPQKTQTYDPKEQTQFVPSQSIQPKVASGTINKDPIYPVANSLTHIPQQNIKNYSHYNTLGQPVEMLPADIYRPVEPPLPQTLSPSVGPIKLRNDVSKYSNVKSTMSKTSIVDKNRVGQNTSRSQLQHVYNQYKGSQSYTQQNIPRTIQGGTNSERMLNVAQDTKPTGYVPVERMGGDTTQNNVMHEQPISNKHELIIEQIGDVPVAKEPATNDTLNVSPQRHGKCRNGLQDVTFTTYPSAAWSFHGQGHAARAPFSSTYRFPNRS